MRGYDKHQESMFSYISPEKRVPPGHPLRRVREVCAVIGIAPDTFKRQLDEEKAE